MRKPNRLTQLIVAFLAVFSLVATTTPASANVVSGVHITAKKKVLSKEQKKAKAAVSSAEKTLKSKEKSLKSAIKTLKKADKNLAKAQAKAAKFKSVVKSKSYTKAMKSVKSAQRTRDRAAALVDSRTRARDKALADLTNKQARYAWLMADLSTMDCGVGTQVPAANGAIETVNECGIVYDINDGDTVWVKTTQNSIVEVRNIGLQTPELKKVSGYPEQCGATAAKNNFRAMMTPAVTVVQLRSITGKSNNWLKSDPRAERSIYIINPVTGLFDIDVQAEQMKAGWSFFWPSSAEWTHNKEYLGYLLEARAAGRGMWNPNACGTAEGVTPEIWLNADSPSINGSENAFGEYVLLHNPTGSDINLQGWSLRDGSLDFFSHGGNWEFGASRFQSNAVIPAGGTLTVYISNPAGYSLTSNEISYFRSDWRMPSGYQIANGSVGTATNPNYAHGDGIYLLDPKGNVRASMLSVCSTTVVACDKPAWVTNFMAENAGRTIPGPVTLSMWKDSSRDIYNPVVSIAAGATASATKTALEAKRFSVSIAVADGPLTAGKAMDIKNAAGTSVLNSRVAIAQLPANSAATALTVIQASGNNAVPSVNGLTRQAAHDALIAAGFTSTLTGDGAALVVGEPTLPSGCTQSSCAVGTAITVP